MQGGTDKIKFILSAGTLTRKGLYDLSSFERNNLRTNLNYKFDQNLSVMVDINGRIENRKQSAKDFSAWRYVLNANPRFRHLYRIQ